MANRHDYAYRRLVNILGPDRVRRGPFETFLYGHDFAAMPKAASLQFKFDPDFVVLPRTTEEVVRLVQLQAETNLPIVPRGGGTGLYGASVPNRGGLLIDFRMMNRVVKIDADARTITVEAGVTWKEAHDRAWAAGFFLPTYPQFAIGSTIGGWINNGGVGIGALSHGTARDHVINIEAVLSDGTTVQTGSDRIDIGTSHLNLAPLLWGSEGTLALITRVTLRLQPKPEELRPLAFTFDSLVDSVPALRELAGSEARPYHVALYGKSHLQLVKAVRYEAPEPASTVLVALAGPKDELTEREKIVEEAMAGNGGARMGAETSTWLWDNRMYPYPTRRISGGLVVAEGLVPLNRLGDVLQRTLDLRNAMKMEVGIHALLADRNTVALIPYFLDDETNPLPPARLGFVVKFRELVMDFGGHPMGVGLFMPFNIPAMHGNAHRYFRNIKEAMDPAGRINAGKMHEIRTKFDFPGLRRIPLALAALPIKALGYLKVLTPKRDRFTRKYEARRGSR